MGGAEPGSSEQARGRRLAQASPRGGGHTGLPVSDGCHACLYAQFLQLYPTLDDPMDCSPPGSSVHDILQARILEWVTMLSSRKSSQPRDGTHISYQAWKPSSQHAGEKRGVAGLLLGRWG